MAQYVCWTQTKDFILMSTLMIYGMPRINKCVWKLYRACEVEHTWSVVAVVVAMVVVVISSPHQSPRWGVSRFRPAQSTTIPLSCGQVPYRRHPEAESRSSIAGIGGSATKNTNWSEWKLPLRGRITYRHCHRPRLMNFLHSSGYSCLA